MKNEEKVGEKADSNKRKAKNYRNTGNKASGRKRS